MSGDHDNSIPSFGTLLRRSRHAAGLSQEELAERAAISAQAIGRLERGDRQWPYPATLRRLADALGLVGEARSAFLTHVPPHMRGVRGRASQHHAEHREERLAEQATGETGSLQAPSTPTVDGATGDTDRAVTNSAGGEVRPDGESLSVRAGLPDLPIPLTPLVGREDDVASVCALLREGARMLTLTGPGGVGKTRLGLQIAAELQAIYADGVAFVTLAPLTDAELVLPAIAQVLGVRESGEHPLAEQVRHALRRRQVLLVLDNFEHVLAASAHVSALLEGCPHVAVMATSRATLRLRGEQEYPVAPLALPPFERPVTLDEAARSPAVRLFVARAQAASPAFALTATNAAAVAAICGRLDGLPLALELAAPRVKLLAPSELLERLHHTLPLLSGGGRDAPARQQTLRATIAWSYDLLDAREQSLFRRLAVFAGGCTSDAAQAVCVTAVDGETGAGDIDEDGAEVAATEALERLCSLVDKSLLQVRQQEGETRFALLETMREYALEQLATSGEAAALAVRHRDWYLRLVGEWTPASYVGWNDARLAVEQENLRAALRCSIARRESEAALRLWTGCWGMWSLLGRYREGQAWLADLLQMPSVSQSPRYPYALALAANLAYLEGDWATATAYLDEALPLAHAAQNQQQLMLCYHYRGHVLRQRGELAEAEDCYLTALAHHEAELAHLAAPQTSWPLNILHGLARARFERGDLAGAWEAFEQLRALPGTSPRPVAQMLATLLGAWLAAQRGDRALFSALLQEGLTLLRAHPNPECMILACQAVAETAADSGDAERASQHLARLLAVAQDTGARFALASALETFAQVVAGRDPERALALCGTATAVRAALGVQPTPRERGRVEQWMPSAVAMVGRPAAEAAGARGQLRPLADVLAEVQASCVGMTLPAEHLTEPRTDALLSWG